MASQRIPGLPSTDYYAPDYRIEVEGRAVSPEVKGDVLDLKVVMDMENMTSFEFNVSNWDDQHLAFKYSDTTTFDIGNRVHVLMGYAGQLRSMMVGQVNTLSPKFPETGPPTIAVSGLDGMAKLKEAKQTRRYTQMADWEIAQQVASRHGLRFEATREGETHELVVQKDQDDAQFLTERAARIDRDCYILTDPESGEDTLYFIRPTDGRDSRATQVYVFQWGQSLINFNPRLTLSRQVSSVTVRGWNERTRQAISYTATRQDLPGAPARGASGPAAAEQSMRNRQEVVVDAPVTSEQEARELAISLLRERAYEFITGTGQVIGVPDLRPGYNVELQGLGTRFSGAYYLKRVEHQLTANGYLTSFEVRRVFDGGSE